MLRGLRHTDGVPDADPLLDPPSWAPAWFPAVDDVRSMRVLRWLVRAVFLAGLTACVVEGADRPADPELGADPTVATTTTSSPTGSSPTGSAPATSSPEDDAGVTGLAARFGTALVELVTSTGEVLELCLLHADSPAERSQGLMGVTDLEGHDGMLFGWDEPASSAFVMIGTPTPLSISWWDAEGAFVSGTDMTPCVDGEPAVCERYGATGPYLHAIEVFAGELPEAAPGASIEVVPGRSCQTPP